MLRTEIKKLLILAGLFLIAAVDFFTIRAFGLARLDVINLSPDYTKIEYAEQINKYRLKVKKMSVQQRLDEVNNLVGKLTNLNEEICHTYDTLDWFTNLRIMDPSAFANFSQENFMRVYTTFVDKTSKYFYPKAGDLIKHAEKNLPKDEQNHKYLVATALAIRSFALIKSEFYIHQSLIVCNEFKNGWLHHTLTTPEQHLKQIGNLTLALSYWIKTYTNPADRFDLKSIAWTNLDLFKKQMDPFKDGFKFVDGKKNYYVSFNEYHISNQNFNPKTKDHLTLYLNTFPIPFVVLNDDPKITKSSPFSATDEFLLSERWWK